MKVVCPSKYGIKRPQLRLKSFPTAVSMRREQTKRTFKLRLLAFVLALALTWYSVNPTPRFEVRRKREDEQPDAKKREAAPRPSTTALPPVSLGRPVGGAAKLNLPIEDEDDFDWPEFIDG